jgi:hypothetical protein
MTTGMQKSLAYCGAAFVLLLFPGMVMAGLLPPYSPGNTAEQVAQFWSTNTGFKRCGLVIMLASTGLLLPFGSLLAVRIRQMEGRFSPLAYLELAAAAVGMLVVVLPVFAFALASYRPARAPDVTQAFNDFGWLLFVWNWPAAALQCLAVGFAIFGYQGSRPVWPRWVAYYNFWCAFVFAAGAVVLLFKDGVFAWNGLLAFWLVAVFFGAWFLVMTWQLIATIGTLGAEFADSADDFAITAEAETAR